MFEHGFTPLVSTNTKIHKKYKNLNKARVPKLVCATGNETAMTYIVCATGNETAMTYMLTVTVV